ncbi:hypothetical protein, partial [Mycobacterium tuberculosis]
MEVTAGPVVTELTVSMLCSYLTAATVVMAEPAVAAVTVGPVGLAVTHLRVGRAARVLAGTVVPA